MRLRFKYINKYIDPNECALQHYSECSESHEPNEVTKIVLDNVKKRKGLKRASTVEELFKKLKQ